MGKWRQDRIYNKTLKDWEPGQRTVYKPQPRKQRLDAELIILKSGNIHYKYPSKKPRQIKSRIIISKNGAVYYTTYMSRKEGYFRK